MNKWIRFPVDEDTGHFINDKSHRITDEIIYMADRLATMFDWKGLPETIPAYIMERLLQFDGNACIFKHNDNIYATFGGLGGEPDYNYEPTMYVIANPALNYSAELKIGTDCVRMRNDAFGWGLLPLHAKYASLICESNITIRLALIQHRINQGLIADNDRSFESAQDFLSGIEEGTLAPIMSEEFFEGVHALEGRSGAEKITDIIEGLQYSKASWYNDLGLNSNYNMKRERIAAPEAQMTDDALLPLVDEMLERRRIGCEEVNKMFGTEWSVDFAGAWLKEHLKQQVNGADFDSDKDTNIDEEILENGENEEENPEASGMDSGDISIDDDNGSNGNDNISNENSGADSEGAIDSVIDVSVIVNNNGDDTGDNEEVEESEVEENEEDQTETD